MITSPPQSSTGSHLPNEGFTDHGDRLLRLALELVVAQSSAGCAISSITFEKSYIAVTRGPATLDPATFRLTDIAEDLFGLLR